MSAAKHIAHDLDAKTRTIDVESDRTVTFEQLGLHPLVLAGLKKNNFIYPSPIQLRAIPVARCGRDLYIQAKSGTGKTVVFTVCTLERFLETSQKGLTALVLTPTREIAVQVQGVMSAVGSKINKFTVETVIGGTDIAEDRKKVSRVTCLVGTPGRVLHLMQNQVINPQKIQFVVLDEADKLMIEGFKKAVTAIVTLCSNRKQTLVVSATFDAEIEATLNPLMNKPLGVTPKKENPILLGISQFIYRIPLTENISDEMKVKMDHLAALLLDIDYNQCLIFVNSQNRAQSYCNLLIEKGFMADLITGCQDQNTRLKTFKRIQVEPNCKVIVTTDLLARGIDAERVNVVINLELPTDEFCYLHRIGRAGRFGSLGLAINIISNSNELMQFKSLMPSEKTPIYKMTKENAKLAWKSVENQKVIDDFELFFDTAAVETTPNGSLNTAESVHNEDNDEDMFLKKIEELQLYSEDIKSSTPPAEVSMESNASKETTFEDAFNEIMLHANGSEEEGTATSVREDGECTTTQNDTSSASDSEDSSDDELSEPEDNFFSTASTCGDDESFRYDRAYSQWSHMYYNQVTQIQNYVQHHRFLQQNLRSQDHFY